MENYKSKFQEIKYNEDKKLLIQTWTKESEYLEEENFKSEMLEFRNFFNQNEPDKILIDHRNFKFPVIPELQDWINKNINSKLSEQKAKTAFIVSSDFFTSVSVEQTINEKSGEQMYSKFFENIEEAEKWLEI